MASIDRRRLGPVADARPVQQDAKELPTKRLAEGVVPPTNRWFSGLVFGDKPQPVFPLPLVVRSHATTGFAFGLPRCHDNREGHRAAASGRTSTVDVGAANAQVSALRHADRDRRLPATRTGKVLGQYPDRRGLALRHARGRGADAARSTRHPSVRQGWRCMDRPRQARSPTGWSSTAGRFGGTVKLDKGGTATWFVVPHDGGGRQARSVSLHIRSPAAGLTTVSTVTTCRPR